MPVDHKGTNYAEEANLILETYSLGKKQAKTLHDIFAETFPTTYYIIGFIAELRFCP
jgi:hypothetical protein